MQHRIKHQLNLKLFPGSWRLVALSLVAGALTYGCAELLLALIQWLANLLFRGEFSWREGYPLRDVTGWHLLVVPVAGSLFLGWKARFVDAGIRGHGIPEVIERFNNHDGAIPPRLLLLRPLASAISIGSGGPYGAEGPVIGLGSAIGSVLGQALRLDPFETRTLLCAGGAAGVAAVFGTPVGALFLMLELFMRSHSIRSLLPVALASLTAYGLRALTQGTAPLFQAAPFGAFGTREVLALGLVSALVGLAAALVIHLVEFCEEGYEKLPVHWMWWPAIGMLPLALTAFWVPRLLGPGYDMMSDLMNVTTLTKTLALLCLAKGLLWSIAVSSRTTGGTLAPLLVTGGGVGALATLALQGPLGLSAGIAAPIALLSMGAFFGAIAGAPVSATFLVLEMTGRLELLPIGLLASVVATLVTKGFAARSIMSTSYN